MAGNSEAKCDRARAEYTGTDEQRFCSLRSSLASIECTGVFENLNRAGGTQTVGLKPWGNVGESDSDAYLMHSERFEQFTALLDEWGFSTERRLLIQDALRQTGLQIVVDEAPTV